MHFKHKPLGQNFKVMRNIYSPKHAETFDYVYKLEYLKGLLLKTFFYYQVISLT